MSKYFLCSALKEDGVVDYIVYDSTLGIIRTYDYTRAVEIVMHREVENAKLENTVIKATDNKEQVRLSYEERGKNSVFYIIYHTDNMLEAVSNRGEKFIMSMNVAVEYFKDKRLLNAEIWEDTVNVSNVKNFDSALNRDYRYARTH